MFITFQLGCDLALSPVFSVSSLQRFTIFCRACRLGVLGVGASSYYSGMLIFVVLALIALMFSYFPCRCFSLACYF